MGEIKKLGKHSLVYGFGIVASKLAGFLMLPIYTRLLTPSDYGILELLTTTVDLIGTITSLGLASAVFKFRSEQETEERRDLVVSTSQTALLALALVTSAAGFAAAPLLDQVVLGRAGRPLYFQIFFVIYFFQTAQDVPLLYLRAEERPFRYITASLSKLVLMLGLNIWFVVFLRLGILGVLWGNLFANAVVSTLLVAYTIRHAGAGFSTDLARSMAAFGGPLVVWSLANFVLVFSDRYFLRYYADTAAVGIYSLAYRFAMALTALGFQPFWMMWSQQRFEVAKRDDAQELFPRVFSYMNLSLGLIGLGIVLFVDEVVRVMSDPSFHPAYHVVPLLIAAQVIYHWVPFSNLGLFLEDRSQTMGKIGVLSAAVMVGLNFLFVPSFGVWGAAWATLLTYVIRYVLIYLTSQRVYEVDHGWPRIGRIMTLLVTAFGIEQLLAPEQLVPSVLTSAAIAATAIALVYFWVLDDEERKAAMDGFSTGVAYMKSFRRQWVPMP